MSVGVVCLFGIECCLCVFALACAAHAVFVLSLFACALSLYHHKRIPATLMPHIHPQRIGQFCLFEDGCNEVDMGEFEVLLLVHSCPFARALSFAVAAPIYSTC